MNLLLLSSSRFESTDFLEHAESLIKQHLGTSTKRVVFIPYAGISKGFDDYEHMVAVKLSSLGYQVESIHHASDKLQAISQAEAILVGGGNTFCLLNSLYQLNLIPAIQEKVRQGTPYIGWSAGSNIASPTIKTTNDMPIIEPKSFNSLKLIPFQINPHYLDGNPPGHNGETREMRINEFLITNPKQKVIGLPEGGALKVVDNKITYIGEKPAFEFRSSHQKLTIPPATDLSYLLG